MEQCHDTRHSLIKAQCVHVLESEATKDFLRARRDVDSGWSKFKKNCQVRHMWGIYLRSNLDWDGITANCLEQLFELPEEGVPAAAPIPTVDLGETEANTRNLSNIKTSPPTDKKGAYKSATEKTQCKTVVPCPSSEDVAFVGDLFEVTDMQDEASVISLESCCAGGGETVEGPGVSRSRVAFLHQCQRPVQSLE